ncbi:MAG TPA: 50S ribosomal protein L11 methyltransferase [Acidobacteriota bacterium]|nr:50S ribosomal protein L11 methyltransferase [Acidobacteriota bacterium]
MDSGELLAMLHDGESLGSWEKDGTLHIFWPEDQWNDGTLEDLKKILARMGVTVRDEDLTIRAVPDQDWNATWAASLEPIHLGRRVRIRQSWHAPDPAFKGIELVIDPKRAFGTGYHATTQLVVEWLDEHIRGGERILDVGTGSGILAMTAIRFGAASALGIDNDPVAIECAREYAELNGFGPELDLRVASFDGLEAGKFDVIVANLDIRTLPRLCESLRRLMSDHAFACLSGLQEQDYEEISAVLNRQGFEISARCRREDWLALSIGN